MTASLHRTDFFDWSMEQAALLKAGRLSEIDVDLLAEEIEDMGNEVRAVALSSVIHILEHLLKMRYSRWDRLVAKWQAEILRLRFDLEDRLTPSIADQIDIDTLYRKAMRLAATGMTEQGFADRLPAVSLDQVRDEDYWPERECA